MENPQRTRTIAVGLIIAGVVCGALVLIGGAILLFSGGLWRFTRPRMVRPNSGISGAESNGEAIYLHGVTADGERVPFNQGPPWLVNRGGGCAVCHGEDGAGGDLQMMMSLEVPNVQYDHLTEEEHDEHGEEEGHPPYTEATVRRAITEGVNPAGEPLDHMMPRWRLEDDDLNDLIAYLKELGDGHADEEDHTE
jgi:mono/diheme cytochrome c family protein